MPTAQTETEPEDFVTRAVAARRAGVSTRWLEDRTRAGEIPCFKVAPNLVLVDPKDVAAFIRAHRVPAPGQHPTEAA